MSRCPVCGAARPSRLIEVDARLYFRCGVCEASFLDPAQRPSLAEERAHYDHHRNAVGDPAYRRFLAKLAEPLLQHLSPGAHGLDFGCGPGPALAEMLVERGHHVALYDPHYHPDTAVLETTYDFVTCTEVVEHLHDPAGTFGLLARLVRPGGWLAVMTCFQTDDTRFRDWHYRRDPTHVVFYRESTMRHIADHYGWHCEVPVKDVALMRRPLSTG